MKMLALLTVLLSGCAGWYANETRIKIPTPHGEASYRSDKECTECVFRYNPKTGEVYAKVGKSGTQEAVINAATMTSERLSRIAEAALPFLMKMGATAGGGPGAGALMELLLQRQAGAGPPADPEAVVGVLNQWMGTLTPEQRSAVLGAIKETE